jgi:hypothetical protein
MADGSIYVAVISASAAILAAAVSAVSVAHQNARQAERDRQQRREELQRQHEEQVRRVCMDLLRAAIDLRTQVENNRGYQGQEMMSRLAQVRKHGSDAALHAVQIGMIEPDAFSDLAKKLAQAAGRLAQEATENSNLEMNSSNELNDRIEDFSERAVTYAKGEAQSSKPVAGKLHRHLTMRR